MPRYNPQLTERDLADFLEREINTLATRNGDPIFDYLDQRIRNQKDFDNLVAFVMDSLSALETVRKLRGEPLDAAIDIASYFSAALIMDDRSIQMSRDEEREIASLAQSAKTLQDLIEDLAEEQDRGRSGRGGYNDYRSGGGRQSYRDRRDYQDSRGGGYARPGNSYGGGRRENNYARQPARASYQDRRGGSDVPNGLDRRSHNPAAALLKSRQAREEQEMARDDDRDYAPRQGRSAYRGGERPRMPDPREVNTVGRAPAYERVEPAEVTKPTSWSKAKTAPAGQAKRSAKGNPLPPSDRPLDWPADRDHYDFTDPEVFLAVPLDPKLLARSVGRVVWEADAVNAGWTINQEGYREWKFEKLKAEEKEEMDRKLHELPILAREHGENRLHPQNEALRDALGSRRFTVEANRKARDQEAKEYQETIDAIKAENEGKPENEQRALPEAPEIQTLPYDQVLTSSDVVKGFGLGFIRLKEMARLEKETSDLKGEINSRYTAYQSVAESYEPIYTATDKREAERIIDDLLSTGLLVRNEVRVNMIMDLYSYFKAKEKSLPAPMVSAAKRHVVRMVNSILELDMGSSLEITDFEDISTMYDDVCQAAGREFADKFGKALSHHMANFQLFTLGSGLDGVESSIDERTIYTVTRVNMVVAPMLARDFKLIGQENLNENSGPMFVSQHATPRLWKAISGLQLNAPDDIVRRQFIHLADNSWMEIRQDFQDRSTGSFIIEFKDNVA